MGKLIAKKVCFIQGKNIEIIIKFMIVFMIFTKYLIFNESTFSSVGLEHFTFFFQLFVFAFDKKYSETSF